MSSSSGRCCWTPAAGPLVLPAELLDHPRGAVVPEGRGHPLHAPRVAIDLPRSDERRKISWPAARSAAVTSAFQARSAVVNSGPAKCSFMPQVSRGTRRFALVSRHVPARVR